ncbi:MAG: DUF262 domain-containing protein [Deltaproteobacteria bacterium]|nr:DUF262 domain-containing protein [Myxococcales bacterium]MDP3214482.1 DUF262 domain-containing protein [Deltaproteobacteria bacterium]
MSATSGFETKTYRVARLLEAIRKGEVRVPLFQRSFVWTDEDRRLLFDSIHSGYPIGTLLLARGPAPAGTLRLGGYHAEVSETDDALWVVDGQQRLSTLAIALLGDSTGAYRPIYFDLEKNVYLLGPRRRTPPAHWVPTHLLGAPVLLNRWLREANLPEELSDRADEAAGRIREYEIPAYLVPYRGPDDQVPKEIFARVNRRGRALKTNEVFDALHISTAGVKPMESVESSLAVLGFGAIGRSIIERSAIAVASHTPQRIEDAIKDANVPELFNRVAAALSATIAFLSEEAGVPHVELLPYDGAIPTLARFFSQFSRPSPRNVELLGRWFWRGMLSGDSQTNNAVDGRRWKAIEGDESGAVQRLLGLQPAELRWADRPLSDFRRGTANSKVELCALSALMPRVLVGGEDEQGTEVPIASLLNDAERQFPIQFIEPSGDGKPTLAMYLAHGSIGTRDKVAHIADALRRASPSAESLATHGIDPVAWEAFVRGDTLTFLARRTERLTSHVRAFLAARAGVGSVDRDRPPLDSYFEDEGA